MTISSDTLPISLLESAHKAFDPLELGIQSVLHSRRWPIAVGDFAYVLAAQAKRAGDATYGPVVKFFPVNRRSHIIWQRDNDSSGDVPLGNSKYLDADISVNKKMREQVTGAVRLPLGDRIWELRKTRGLTQTQLAEILGVRQSAVARWETSKDRPLPQTLIKISELVNEEERQWWRDLAAESAGFGEAGGSTLPEVSFSRTIPLIKTHNKVGILGSVDPLDVEVNLTLPAEWFPESGSIRAVRINANSISPLVDGAYIAVIDISRRDADRLVGCMVAIQTTVGIDVRWLRKDGSTYLLVPLRESTDHPIRVMRHRGENSIVGQVVKWIGQPAAVRK
ncbi:MAG TPA: helix-turn-helix transcriptional regulator [Silvibacterium sp.]|nr:helix-turn-helix transcriptional regulator [Silvibacterium sp.]